MQEWRHSSICRIAVCISVWMTPDIRMNCRFILSWNINRWERYGSGRQIIKYLFSENTYTRGTIFAFVLFLHVCPRFRLAAILPCMLHCTEQRAQTVTLCCWVYHRRPSSSWRRPWLLKGTIHDWSCWFFGREHSFQLSSFQNAYHITTLWKCHQNRCSRFWENNG